MAVHQLSYEPRAPDLAFEVSVPLPMRSNVDGQGGRGWWDRYRLVRQQHDLVGNAFLRHSREVTALTSSRSRGYTVRLTRIAKDAGDDDNAASAVKGIRDAVAKILCIDDGAAAIRFLPVGQEVEEKLEVPRVRIEIWLSQEICSACKQHVAPRRTNP